VLGRYRRGFSGRTVMVDVAMRVTHEGLEAANATASSRSFKSCFDSAFFAFGLFSATQYTPGRPLAFCMYA